MLLPAGNRFILTACKALAPTRLCQKRTKFSDSFREVYKWKNARNRPAAQNEGNLQLEAKEADLTLKTVYHLEQLSLVDFSNQAAVDRLASAIRYANRLRDVDTTGIKPLYTLLENETLELRPDEITEGNQKDEVLRNAKITLEDYYLAPPGNIPLEQIHQYGSLQEAASNAEMDEKQMKIKKAPETSVEMKKARRKA